MLKIKITSVILGIFVIGAVIGGFSTRWWISKQTLQFNAPFQAVLLDNGQVYYGKVEGLGTEFPVLREVYYIRQTQDPTTKQVSNILIRRGQEWHSPAYTVINARHLMMVEPVGVNSKVASLIQEQESRK